MGWIGVDLDGTLATKDFGEDTGVEFDPNRVGEPVGLMLERVRQWVYDGVDVRIFTARASQPNFNVKIIHDWLANVGLPPLPVICVKDYHMDELWDDRCVQVEPNTGRRMDGKD